MKDQQTKNIGLVTFHNVYNYGGVLQAYGLCRALETHNIECIDYQQQDLDLKYNHKLYDGRRSLKQNAKHFVKHFILKKGVKKENKIKEFITEYIPLSKGSYKNITEVDVNSKQYDVLISGSDQIWNPQFTGGKLDPVYLLAFGNDRVKRLSYASSAGAHKFANGDRKTLTASLGAYKNISVREQFLKDQIATFMDKDVKVVVDPTLLLTGEEWRTIAKPLSREMPKDYVLIYTFDNNSVCINLAKDIAKKLGCKVVFISSKKQKADLVDICLEDVGPNEFIWLFDNARFVVTNSFHGTTFSLIFKKDFYSIYKNSNPYRVLNLLDVLGLKDRLIKNADDLADVTAPIDYTTPSKLLSERREDSIKFLFDSL